MKCKRSARAVLLIVLACVVILCLFSACGLQEPDTVLSDDYYDWSGGTGKQFVWNGERYQSADKSSLFSEPLQNEDFSSPILVYIKWGENESELTGDYEKGLDPFYLFESKQIQGCIVLVPAEKEIHLFENPRPLAFILTNTQSGQSD